MIEKMKVVYIVSQETRKTDMLNTLRDLGILHLAEKKNCDPLLSQRLNTISRLAVVLKDYAKKNEENLDTLTDEQFETMFSDVQTAINHKAEMEAMRSATLIEAEKLRLWGDFDVKLINKLRDSGINLRFYRMGAKEYKLLKEDENIKFIHLASVEKMETVAVIGDSNSLVSGIEFVIPEKGISKLNKDIAFCDEEIKRCDELLSNAAKYLSSYSQQLLKTQNLANYSSVSETVEKSDGLVYLSGYIPASEEESFTLAAKTNGWAWYLQDVDKDDTNVPTKIKYNKVTALIRPVFDVLGTVPGYREYDISFWFLSFFALFFAMIIGDAGYGVLFLIGAIAITIKTKKLVNATLLLYVLSITTIVWGAITGTWFGLEKAMEIPFLKALVIPGLANYPSYFNTQAADVQNNVMKFCFSIGVIQLALACIMNIKRKISRKDLSFVADIGWLASICALYFVVLLLVIGENINLGPIACIVAVGFITVVLFGGMSPEKSIAQGLKSGAADSFTVFLNTISAFGNIMSYIRLFAVGMASLAIAQSFNNMAAGFSGPLVIIGAIIMIFGHAMNIVMGFLSVVVHGVRLNLLEFSGQLGMEWSGTAYDPFRKINIKK